MDKNKTGSTILNRYAAFADGSLDDSVAASRTLGFPLALLLTACAAPPAPPISSAHLKAAPAVEGSAPGFAVAPPLPPPPRVAPRQEVYSVVMQNVNVQDLLFALARDARINVDIHPAISGTVTMNVRDQTLAEILERVARQVDLRYEMQGNNLSILPDLPYLKNYRVDYPNIQRNSAISISTSTNVASTGTAPGKSDGGGSNASTSEIISKSNNQFWDTLISNIRDLLRETDKVIPVGPTNIPPQVPAAAAVPAPASAGAAPNAAATTANAAPGAGRTVFREAASVIANAEAGYISVRATQAQHEKVRDFVERVMRSARRQVLIEATIVEVDLSSRYQQGIDWSLIRPGGTAYDSSFTVRPAGPSSGLQTGGLISSLTSLTLNGPSVFKGYDLTGILNMLESFGTLRVLSSPKISVLNNQSSVLKVVDNKVYFTVSVTAGTAASAGVAATPAVYNTVINTVPIGLLMTVTPQISESSEVILNLRPTISRITGYANDPSPTLAQYGVGNRIPEVQTREMESVLRVQSGGIAILGGLMQDSRNKGSDEVPILNQLPVVGNLFKYRDESGKKTELVIFLRPTVLQDASLGGDFKTYRNVVQDVRDAMDRPTQPSRPEFSLPPGRP